MSGIETENVNRLQRLCTDLEKQLEKEKQEKETFRKQLQERQHDPQLEQRIKLVENKNAHLLEENSGLRAEIEVLSEKLRTLLAELERRRISVSGNDEELVRLLEAQVRQFHIDFESERRDRQLAEARAEELEKQLTVASRELQQRNFETMQSISQRRQAAMQYYCDGYDGPHRIDAVDPSPAVHDLDVVRGGEAYDEIDYRSGPEPDLTSDTRPNVMSPDITNIVPK